MVMRNTSNTGPGPNDPGPQASSQGGGFFGGFNLFDIAELAVQHDLGRRQGGDPAQQQMAALTTPTVTSRPGADPTTATAVPPTGTESAAGIVVPLVAVTFLALLAVRPKRRR